MSQINWFHIMYFTITTGLVRTFFLFALLPMFSTSMIQSKVHRNAVIFALMLVMIPNFLLQLEEQFPINYSGFYLFVLVLKEAFIGLLIGFLFGIPFLAVQSVGFLIDNQRGASIDSTFNPTNDSETTSTGNLLNLYFIAYFFISGLFLQMIGMYFHSFSIWPVFEFFPVIDNSLVSFGLNQLDYIFRIAVTLSGPILLVMFLAEFSLALVNKFAPQLNVFILSLPIKSGIGFFLLTLYIPVLSDYFDHQLFDLADFYRQIQEVLE